MATLLLGAGPARSGEPVAPAEPAATVEIDTAVSHIGFRLATRWGQRLDGHFPHFRGEVTREPDGRRRVRLEFDARTVEIDGHPTYTRFARGGGFFDAADWPHPGFVSDAYLPGLLRDGGTLAGELEIRGVRRRQAFSIRQAACASPGIDCDIVATGSIRRDDYGMGRWNLALSGDVVFELRIRLRPGPPAREPGP